VAARDDEGDSKRRHPHLFLSAEKSSRFLRAALRNLGKAQRAKREVFEVADAQTPTPAACRCPLDCESTSVLAMATLARSCWSSGICLSNAS
jgi:hypothetical protein